jgi:D-erythronate 2-dehydrogenase
MEILITGAAGFLGQKVAQQIAKGALVFDKLVLVDIVLPKIPTPDPRIHALAANLCNEDLIKTLINPSTGLVLHLAAVVSSHAEADFDLGWQVNMDLTRWLLEACKAERHVPKFVFASSCAVFGGQLPAVVQDHTALQPQSSYGSQKAIGELLVNDYSRKGFIKGISLRLPTVCVRPGVPNKAASSFVSGIIREPIAGLPANCPVPSSLPIWVTSPNTVVQNILHAAMLDSTLLGTWVSVNLPGRTFTVQEMVAALNQKCGPEVSQKISYHTDPAIAKIVLSWPTAIDSSRAVGLGFGQDQNFEAFIEQYLAELKS